MSSYVYYPGGFEPFILIDGKEKVPFNCGPYPSEFTHTVLQALLNYKEGNQSLQNAYLNIIFAVADLTINGEED